MRYDFMAGARIVPKNRPSDRKKKRVCVRYKSLKLRTVDNFPPFPRRGQQRNLPSCDCRSWTPSYLVDCCDSLCWVPSPCPSLLTGHSETRAAPPPVELRDVTPPQGLRGPFPSRQPERLPPIPPLQRGHPPPQKPSETSATPPTRWSLGTQAPPPPASSGTVSAPPPGDASALRPSPPVLPGPPPPKTRAKRALHLHPR